MNNKISMNVNVILTFQSMNNFAETQEVFDLTLPVSKDEIDAISFINKQLFKRIVAECRLLNRPVGDLWEISTAADWDTFSEITNLPTLMNLGHNGKWYFGRGAGELSEWERSLSTIHGFGLDTDMSWVGNPALAQQYMDNLHKQASAIISKAN